MTVPAIVGGVSALASAAADYFGASKANAANLASAREQMAFQERMSSTAYQRAVKDMQAAGLNPALMYGHGNSASSPGGAIGLQQNALSGAAHSARSFGRSVLEASLMRQQLDLVKAQTATAVTQANLNKANAAFAEMNTLGRGFQMAKEVVNTGTQALPWILLLLRRRIGL